MEVTISRDEGWNSISDWRQSKQELGDGGSVNPLQTEVIISGTENKKMR